MATIPSSSSLVSPPFSFPLFRRPSLSSTACFCTASSSSSFRCPPLRAATASASLATHRHILYLRGGSTGRRRASGMRRQSGFASPSAKYIREAYLVKKVSARDVGELVKGERSVPLVVDFYATWCGPCIIMAQHLETLAVEYENNVMFVKVDTDEEYEFARDMQVRGLPTLYFISPDPSKDAIRTEGLVPPEMIKNIIDNEM